MDKKSVMLRFPIGLLERVDKFQKEKGFGTRTQAIFYLISQALDINDKSR